MDRIIVKAEFESLLPTIQPAGFKDVGASTYKNPKTGGLSVIVHSPQATANSLESTAWDGLTNKLVEPLTGLPYVEIVDQSGQYRASSITLPHRLASGYLLKHKDAKDFTKQLQADFKALGQAKTIFKYCPNSLVHGVFFSHLGDGSIKIARSLSASVTAHSCKRVTLGGASHDPIDPSGDVIDSKDLGGKKPSALGMGNLPYNQEAFAAGQIDGVFIIDVAQIQSFGLEAKPTELLIALAQYKVAKLLSRPWRIRSGCDLETVTTTGNKLPSLSELETTLKKLISDCSDHFSDVTTVELTLKNKEG